MKLAEAQKLDEQGKLQRKVLTEQGWYVPKRKESAITVKPAEPAVFRRRPGRPRKDGSS